MLEKGGFVDVHKNKKAVLTDNESINEFNKCLATFIDTTNSHLKVIYERHFEFAFHTMCAKKSYIILDSPH